MNEHIYDGMTILITGGAGGFARSAAPMFAELGAKLLLTDFDADGLAEHAGQLRADGVEVATLSGSVADEDHCAETVALALSTYGRLDVAINNAGMSHAQGRTADIDSEWARKTIDINLMGTFYGMKHQLPAMVRAFEEHQRPAAILNVSSLAGIGGAPMIAMYSAAKHGVIGLTKSAALEYVRRGIRINAVCPAFARTPIVTKGLLDGDDDAAKEAHLTRGIPMRRLAEPHEITRSWLWLCDPRNTFMTGQAVALDGGTSAM
ncbi:SDR family oxidoreductase [Rhizobiaceae bacterium]|nr:SDR family oxidoreductase [Rhizobiaceae bacterium]